MHWLSIVNILEKLIWNSLEVSDFIHVPIFIQEYKNTELYSVVAMNDSLLVLQ